MVGIGKSLASLKFWDGKNSWNCLPFKVALLLSSGGVARLGGGWWWGGGERGMV